MVAISESERQRRINFVVERTRRGASSESIAREMNFSARQIQRIKVQANVNRPNRGPLSEDERARAKSMLDDGANHTEVARTLGRSPHVMYSTFPEYPRLSRVESGKLAFQANRLKAIEKGISK